MLEPVKSQPPALAIARGALDARLRLHVADWHSITDGRGRISMIPIYAVSARRLASSRWGGGWRVGGRYLWTYPGLEEGAQIDIAQRRRKHALLSFSWSKSAPQLVQILSDLSAAYDKDHNRYRPRLLRLPWIGINAIWLNACDTDTPDRFVGLSLRLSDDEFRDEVRNRAKAFRERERPADPDCSSHPRRQQAARPAD